MRRIALEGSGGKGREGKKQTEANRLSLGKIEAKSGAGPEEGGGNAKKLSAN